MHDTSSNVRTLQDILNSNTWPSAQEDDDDTNIVQQFDIWKLIVSTYPFINLMNK